MKKNDDHAIIRVVVATGISSVVTQLITIREFLAQFQGNEIVIALILFNWLVLGATGTLLARVAVGRNRQSSAAALGWMSLVLSGLGMLQILAIRLFRDMVFIHGSSVGFYPTWLFTFLAIAPYCLLLGFVLPYSLFVIRAADDAYPGGRIYITDNIGDVAGGVLFSFILVYLVSPLQAVLLGHLPLLGAVYFLFPARGRHRLPVISGIGVIFTILVAGAFVEKWSLAPPTGELVYYKETRYGRIAVHKDQEQYTLFEDGVPSSSSQNLGLSEEIIHFPLAGLEAAGVAVDLDGSLLRCVGRGGVTPARGGGPEGAEMKWRQE